MPELPDLEVFKNNIYKKLTSKRLVDVNIFNHNKVTTPLLTLKQQLSGRELATINRFGKELLFDFTENQIIAVHLMLNGKVSIVTDPFAVENIKFKIFALTFENETIVFSDMGGLCTVKYNPISDGVPDVFGADFTVEYFLDIARKKARMNIKAFLINQQIAKGIGNAYADEILWHARISPHSKVGKIPDPVLYALYHSISVVLKEAIVSIKAIKPDIISGEERSFLKVHIKSKRQTETGYPIKVEKIASKTTYYTDEQILYQ